MATSLSCLLLLLCAALPAAIAVDTDGICAKTPFPAACLASTKLSISLQFPPDLLSFAVQSVRSALFAASGVVPLLSNATGDPSQLVESKRGAVRDCVDLHGITLSSLSFVSSLLESPTTTASSLRSARAHLSAALSNRATCLDGLDGSAGPLLFPFLSSWSSAYQHVSNSLSLVANLSAAAGDRNAPTESAQKLPPSVHRRLLQQEDGIGDGAVSQPLVLKVAKDGSGQYTSVSAAVEAAPSNSNERVFIKVKAGVYEENVELGMDKKNIMLVGDGRDVTVITAARSVGGGWTSFRSATVAVSGEGFLARDITFRNTAGAASSQAVALRINADLAAVYRCAIDGYQDTLYVHSFRQFYRECDIYGTIDFIFGNAAAVFQGCNFIARAPLPGQSNVVTAQNRDDPNEDTGISIQNCSVIASSDFSPDKSGTKTYLGRPWNSYSRTVYLESYIGSLIDPTGWAEWPGSSGSDTVYYGEYMNSGPGSGTEGRVLWEGFHVMSYDEASRFSLDNFISGGEWLSSTSVPYDDDI